MNFINTDTDARMTVYLPKADEELIDLLIQGEPSAQLKKVIYYAGTTESIYSLLDWAEARHEANRLLSALSRKVGCTQYDDMMSETECTPLSFPMKQLEIIRTVARNNDLVEVIDDQGDVDFEFIADR